MTVNATSSPPLSSSLSAALSPTLPGSWSPPLPIVEAPPRERLRGTALIAALLGLAALGGAAALGVPDLQAAPRLIPSVLLVEVASLALSAPALIALHQFMGLAAEPEALAGALGRALIHGGRVGAGLAVLVLFFSATTALGPIMLLLSLAAVGVFTSATACVELHRAELLAARQVGPRFTGLVLAWVVLGWIIALRVGVDVARWVVGG